MHIIWWSFKSGPYFIARIQLGHLSGKISHSLKEYISSLSREKYLCLSPNSQPVKNENLEAKFERKRKRISEHYLRFVIEGVSGLINGCDCPTALSNKTWLLLL